MHKCTIATKWFEYNAIGLLGRNLIPILVLTNLFNTVINFDSLGCNFISVIVLTNCVVLLLLCLAVHFFYSFMAVLVIRYQTFFYLL